MPALTYFNPVGPAEVQVSNDTPLPTSQPLNPVVGSAHSSGAAISSSTTLTPPAGASRILVQALTQNIRFTLDGSAPTASQGFQILAGSPPTIIPVGTNATLKVIEEAASASLQYQWMD